MARELTGWDPVSDLLDRRSRLDRVLGDVGVDDGMWAPAVDVVRDGVNLIYRAELPGIKPDDVLIEVEDGVLTVSGQHDETAEENDGSSRYLRRERRSGAFSRSIVLPSGTDAKKIEAATHDGLVEVTVPLPKDLGPQTIHITPTPS